MLPNELKYGLHLLLIAHGKAHCSARRCRNTSECPLCSSTLKESKQEANAKKENVKQEKQEQATPHEYKEEKDTKAEVKREIEQDMNSQTTESQHVVVAPPVKHEPALVGSAH